MSSFMDEKTDVSEVNKVNLLKYPWVVDSRAVIWVQVTLTSRSMSIPLILLLPFITSASPRKNITQPQVQHVNSEWSVSYSWADSLGGK